MNFIAIIGIVDQLIKMQESDSTVVKIKVEKPFIENQDDEWYDLVDVKLDKNIFKKELNLISTGSLVGIKGRIKMDNNYMHLVGERLQVF
ncbi:MAG: hypothetical protein LBV37_00525 [Mycoplasmataceae bacterium]|jgi:hypothetical protein|nr:hypothetical protein [Mycoplasmataceae bacterium]